jgi:tetratricopeptide (TPR) repeat protein
MRGSSDLLPQSDTPAGDKMSNMAAHQQQHVISAWLRFLTVVFLTLVVASPALSQQTDTRTPPELQTADQEIIHGNFSAAASLLTQLAARQPEPSGVETRLGRINYELHAYDKAIPHLELALKQDPEDAEAAELLGLCYFMEGKSDAALELLKQSVPRVTHPLPVALDILGGAYLQAHQFSEARAVFARMYGVPSESAQGHLIAAQMMIREDMADEAIPELQKAVALDPKLPMAHLLLGEAWLSQSHVRPALQEFQKELQVNPVQWLAYWRMGDAYSRLGELIQAEQALEKSIWIDPNFTGPYILLGRVELRKGDPALAARFLEHALKMDPNNYTAHYLLGQAYDKLGRKADASREFALTRTLHAEKDRQ